MLSAQVDRLRELATKYGELESGAVRVVRISLDTGSVLREAADTILSLRDKAQELQAENAKLRELLDFALPIAMYAASTEEGDRMRELMREVEL